MTKFEEKQSFLDFIFSLVEIFAMTLYGKHVEEKPTVSSDKHLFVFSLPVSNFHVRQPTKHARVCISAQYLFALYRCAGVGV